MTEGRIWRIGGGGGGYSIHRDILLQLPEPEP